MRKNVDIKLTADFLTIRIDLFDKPEPSNSGRLVLATTGGVMKNIARGVG